MSNLSIYKTHKQVNPEKLINGWKIYKINEVLEKFIDFRGKTPLKIGMNWGGGDIPALSANNVEMGKINLNKETYYASERLYEKWMNKGDPEKGDILLTMEAPLGNVAQIPDNRKYILSQRVILLKTKQDIVFNDFFKHKLMSDDFQFILKSYSTGTTATGIQQAKLILLPILIPPLPEQQKIAEILDTVEKAIALTQTHINKLKLAKAGLLHDLLTKGIDEHGELRNPKRNPEQFKDSPLGKIPKDWEVVRLENLIEKITSGSRGWANYYSDYGAIFIRIGNLNRESLNLRLEDIVYVSPPSGSEGERTKVQPGDILISITADIGIVGVIPNNFGEAYVNQHIALIRINSPEINYNWIGLFLSQDMGQEQFRKFNDSGAKAGINLPTIASIMISLPNYKEQCKIVSIINHHDNQIISKQTRLEKLKLVKLGLMSDLLTGKVRVKI